MGLQFRKRTKGKNSWINISHSKKNGLSASLSVKVAKGVTMNFGGKGNRRATVNFGNGIRYVKYRTPKAKPKAEPKVKATRTKSYSYTPVEPRKTRDELLEMCQTALIQEAQTNKLTVSADLQEMLDLYNAIDIMRNDPDSLENRDLIIVVTNQYSDLAKRINNPSMVEGAKIISDCVRGLLPEKPKPVVVKEQPFNKTLLWGTLIGICVLIAMCSA